MILFREFQFESAHRLTGVPPEHKCYQLHGHSYRVEVHIEGPVNPKTGMVMDFADVKEAFEPLRKTLDHHCLNDIEGLENPTSEVLAQWIWQRLVDNLPLHQIIVRETAASGVMYRGGE